MTDVSRQAALGTLAAVSPSGLGETFTITGRGLSFGRKPDCTVVISDQEISRLHATLEVDSNGRIVLTDLDSANGTYVNGRRIQTYELAPGDELIFGVSGQHRFEFFGPAEKTVALPVVRPKAHREPTVPMPPLPLERQAHLQLVVDRYTVKELSVPGDGLIVGRNPARSRYAAYFDHKSVSGANAVFEWKGPDLVVRDLGSRNGTFVNGNRITEHVLQEADFIYFGHFRDRPLLFRSGKDRGLAVRDIALTGELIRIGRDPGSEVYLDHPAISRFHAELRWEGQRYILTDLNSANGTFINGKPISRHFLVPDDNITIGPLQFGFDGHAIEQRNAGNDVRIDIVNLTQHLGNGIVRNQRLLLDHISLTIPPRAFVGFLGPSGCGKTTFLDAVSGLRPAASGSVLINGRNLYKFAQSFSTTMGWVPQEDVVHRELTVEECLRYGAGLRLPADTSPEEIFRRVGEVTRQVGLQEQSETPIHLLSGGQRKRVSIAIEILAKPSILLLDEPTAGLDPHSEEQIMQLFRELANQGATLLTTTHVLGSFSLFDSVVTMVQGKLAFCGPPAQLLSYFDVKTPDKIYSRLVEDKRPEEWKHQFEQTDKHKEILQQLRSDTSESLPPRNAPVLVKPTRRRFVHQWRLLTSRYWTIKFKDRRQVAFLLLQAPLVAVLLAFLSSEPNAPATLFMVMFAALWLGCSNAVREISDERAVYRRERQSGLSLPAYLFSKLTLLGGVGVAQSSLLIMVLAIAHLVLQQGGIRGNVTAALFLTSLVSLNGTLIGLFLSALFESSEKALAWFPLVLILELLLAGLFMPVRAPAPILPLTNQQIAEQLAEAAKVEVPPRLAEVMKESGFGGRVRGGVTLDVDDNATGDNDELVKLLGGGTKEMGPVLRWLSTLCVSRWGLEALADLYLHGEHARQDYAYQLHNAVHISLHPGDSKRLRRGLTAPDQLSDARSWSRLAYLGILLGFAGVMTGAVALMLKRGE